MDEQTLGLGRAGPIRLQVHLCFMLAVVSEVGAIHLNTTLPLMVASKTTPHDISTLCPPSVNNHVS